MSLCSHYCIFYWYTVQGVFDVSKDEFMYTVQFVFVFVMKRRESSQSNACRRTTKCANYFPVPSTPRSVLLSAMISSFHDPARTDRPYKDLHRFLSLYATNAP